MNMMLNIFGTDCNIHQINKENVTALFWACMNDMIDIKVKSTVVKRELKRQSLLYDALKNITPKAADEANTALGRIWQNSFNFG